METKTSKLTLDKIFHASVVLKDIVRKTAILHTEGITDLCDLYLKPENLQNTGSFKLRSSGYKIAMLPEEEKKKGVIACSAGNHAQGVALAASKKRDLLSHLPAGQRTDLQNRSDQALRSGNLPCKGLL